MLIIASTEQSIPQKRVEACIFVRYSMVAFPGLMFGILAPILFK